MITYRCACCESATFEHPDDADCESIDGKCEHLARAGWQPVWLRIFLGSAEREHHVLSRGGWICPACVRRFT